MRKLSILFSNLTLNLLIASLFTVLLGFIDYKSGYELSFQFFYFIPLFFVSYNYKIKRIILFIFSIFASLIWLISDFKSGHQYTYEFYFYWNAFSRFVIFTSFSLFLHSLVNQRYKINLLNNEISKKSNLIYDSINYAETIQQAIIPSFNTFKIYFEDSFMLFKPKDILSGDFFWSYKTNDEILFALVDCTGHGVPGSLLSTVGNILLNKIVIEKDIVNPPEVLANLNKELITLFNNGDKSIDDGMEISFVKYMPEKHEIEISQTSQNAIIIDNESNLKEVKFSYFTIGGILSKRKEPVYFSETFMMEHGNMLFLFSDGYVDQFGSSKDKKFGFQNFHQLIKSNYKKPVDQQRDIFEKTILKWKGDFDQTDDITVIGIRF